jgi:ABC-type phosphate/phosphonate transport system ATPase subunit
MLRLHNVAMTYPGGIVALLPTSISFPKGRFVVLIGPSGAGKSTLLRCMNGLVRPTQGVSWSTAWARFSGAATRCGSIAGEPE